MSILAAIESQWKILMDNGAWSEDFTVSLDASLAIADFTLSGVFYSGTSTEESPAQAYAPKRSVRKEAFQISLKSLPSLVTDPKRMLKGAVLTSDARGVYKVLEVRGEKSGTLTLVLNPTETPTSATSYFGISGEIAGGKSDG